MLQVTKKAALLILLSSSLLNPGCGKKKSSDEQQPANAKNPEQKVVAPAKADPCATSPSVLQVSAEVANREKPESFQLNEFTVTDGAAVKLQGGAAYTMFISDYPIERKTLGAATLHPPAGKVLITVMITHSKTEESPQPLTAGQTISTTPDESGRAFELIMERGEDRYTLSREATGKLEVLRLDDSQICVSIDYSDAEKKQVKGVVHLDVVTL